MELLGAIALLVIGFFVFSYYKSKEIEKEIEEESTRVEKFIPAVNLRFEQLFTRHLPTLAIKYDQSVYRDDYGNVKLDKWEQEIDYFVQEVVWKDPYIRAYLLGADSEHPGDGHPAHMNEEDQRRYAARTSKSDMEAQFQAFEQKRTERMLDIKTAIHERIVDYKIEKVEHGSASLPDVETLDPIQYEHHCAHLLNGSGWTARVTQASGDQGIDVVATHGNVKAVFQCKKYSQPVGNAAVQEIIAGKQFEQAHIAAVVSNQSFTQSARQLANATNVFLLHHDELPGFAEKLGLVD